MKQITARPNSQPQQAVQLTERGEVKSELKAKLRHYEINYSSTGTKGGLNATEALENAWDEFDTIDLENLPGKTPNK
jgi:hypothetical protein